MDRPFSLYLHIPFCVRKCAYCDFASWAGRLAEADGYIDGLLSELREAARKWGNREISTLYFGGGTPSLLTGAQMQRIMDAVRRLFPVAEHAEISMEANPGTVDAGKLAAFRAAGINRLSLGVQAAQERLLQRLGRVHTLSQAEEAVRLAREAGFDNLSLDFMYGLPGQTTEDWRQSLAWAAAQGVEHLSCYSLILEEGTPLWQSNPELPDEEAVLEMQADAVRLLAGNGYARYEISNYAKPGRECRHNMVYWQRGDYLGVGCAAHSMMDGVRFANTSSFAEYMRGVRRVEETPLGETDVWEETIMLGLRTAQGIPLEGLEEKKVRSLCGQGLARTADGRLALTDAGMNVHSAIVLLLI